MGLEWKTDIQPWELYKSELTFKDVISNVISKLKGILFR